ncbi:MAG: hypothetical protein JNL98_11500 [Bryobacterales bacterium]|nr:hypothetical protein [Bryobacterales bacterium]
MFLICRRVIAVSFFFLLVSGPCQADRSIHSFAGRTWRFEVPTGLAVDAPLGEISGVAGGPDGSIYLSDSSNHVVVKIDQSGALKIVAGTGWPGFSGDGGPASLAELNTPRGIRIGPDGSLYIADSGNIRVRRVNSDGSIETIAGGRLTYREGLPATETGIPAASDLALDAAGNLYIAGSGIFKVAPDGIVTTFAYPDIPRGAPITPPSPGPLVRSPVALAIGPQGDVYVANYSGSVQRITPAGQSREIYNSFRATAGSLRPIGGLALDLAGNVYLSLTSENRVVMLGTDGTERLVAGSGSEGFSGDGGPATNARLNAPRSLAFDAKGYLLVADTGNGRARVIDERRNITTLAGNGRYRASNDLHPATNASLKSPRGVAVDPAGVVYIADTGHHRVRRVSLDGSISTVAGTGVAGFQGENSPAIEARLYEPAGVAVHPDGSILIADRANHRVRRFSPGGAIRTAAGNGGFGYSGDGQQATQAEMSLVAGLATDRAGNIYVATHSDANPLRKISPDGMVSSVLGTPVPPPPPAFIPNSITLPDPRYGVAVDPSGSLYFCQKWERRVYRMSPQGVITTVAGTGNPGYSGDGGPAIAADLGAPQNIAFDRDGNLYIADRASRRIRRVDTSGIISTVAGNGRPGLPTEGANALDTPIGDPYMVAIGPNNEIYIADPENDRVWVIRENRKPGLPLPD